jgi:hypothetical protein
MAAALALVSSVSHAAPPSPVGTWEVALAGADRGTAYVTFEEDADFTGYGLSRDSNGIFTLAGTWSVDEKGRLSASYTETIDGGTVTGTLSGKVAARRIDGRITATNGNFTFNAKPEGETQDLAGAWNGIATVRRQRLPELYQLTPSVFPHVFRVEGVGYTPATGSYAIAGTALAGSGGRIEIAVISQGEAGNPVATWLRGRANTGRDRNVLKGLRSNGEKVTVSLQR